MVILLAGAGGQLGRDLQPALAGTDLHPFDHRQLDITDAGAVEAAVERVRPDWVINAAAFNDVDGAEQAEDQAFAVNAAGAGNLAEPRPPWAPASCPSATATSSVGPRARPTPGAASPIPRGGSPRRK